MQEGMCNVWLLNRKEKEGWLSEEHAAGWCPQHARTHARTPARRPAAVV